MDMLQHLVSRPELPSPTGERLCRQCADSGHSCCVTDPALTYLSFPLSDVEWRKLAPFEALATPAVPGDGQRFAVEEAEAAALAEELALRETEPAAGPVPSDGDRVAAAEENMPDFIASMHALFPDQKERIGRLFPRKGRHLTLRTRKDGSCVFLGAEGCRLPRRARPTYCLLFPAWVIGDSLTLFLSQDCLISQRARGPAHGITLLGEDPAHIRQLHSRLQRDWGLAPL